MVSEAKTNAAKELGPVAHVRMSLSLEEELFADAEEAARDLKLTRSAVWSLAMTEFLAKRRSRALLEQINAAVDEEPDAETAERLRGMRRLQRKAVSDDRW